MNPKIKNLTVLYVFLTLLMQSTYSQQSNTLCFLKNIPQNYRINPAFQNDCKFFIGLPLVATLNLTLENSPFALSDALKYDKSIDSLITFLHPNADTDAFVSLLKEKNTLNTDAGTSLVSFGFKTGKVFINCDVSQRVFAKLIYPDDLIKLPVYGPDSAMFFDFNKMSANASAWNEIAMGLSYKINDNLQIGWRGKLLSGNACLSTNILDVTLGTGEDLWPVHSHIKMDVSAPFLTVAYDEEGMIDYEKLEFKDMKNVKDISSVFLNKHNLGFSMDFGANFLPFKWLQVSASVVDIGNIKWKKGVYNLQNRADYEFKGVEVDLETESLLKSLADSLKRVFKFSAEENQFSTFLPAKIYLGALIYPNPKIGIGALSRTEIFNGELRQQYTLSANFYPTRIFSAALSYSLINDNYNNIGLGISFKPGPFNFYLISDTGTSILFCPYNARYLNLQLGLNLIFGYDKKPGKKQNHKNSVIK